MNESNLGTILTFYSYKGGTGRTMALANVAWILASRGMRVLTVDWDVEAPGLHRYFAPFLSDPNLFHTDGLLEFLNHYMVNATKEMPEGEKALEVWFEPYADIKRYAEPIQWQFADGGGIDFVGAGRQTASYGARVNNFDWDAFYRKFGGGALLDSSIRQMKAAYDYILIDSRTGISDTSGICTIQLPDGLVVFYTLNNQNIEGASSVAEYVMANRKGNGEQLFPIWTMATRIELAEKQKLEARRQFARKSFAPFLLTLPDRTEDLDKTYWGDMEVLYDPYYAYDEVLATIADLPGRPNSVLAAMERLTAHLSGGQIASLAPMSDIKRRETLQKYYLIAEERLTQSSTSIRDQRSWDVFIAASYQDHETAERLYYLLQTRCTVFYAPMSILAGDSFLEALQAAMKNSRALVILVSRNSLQSKWIEAELEGAQKRYEGDQSFKIIPVLLDATPPENDFIKRFQYLSPREGDVQDVAVRVLQTLGFEGADKSERDQNVRIRTELEEALKEKTRLLEEKARLLRRGIISLSALVFATLSFLVFAFYASHYAQIRSLNAVSAQYEAELALQRLKGKVDQLAGQPTRLLSEVTGIKIGMTLDQVEQAVGKPSSRTTDADKNQVFIYRLPRVGAVDVTLDNSNKIVGIRQE
jgi:TIR domain/CobQ/CobB/MinD/ParA nucleotide binding domain